MTTTERETPGVPAPAARARAAEASPRRKPRWTSRVLAVASVLLFGAGALVIASWLRERRELAEAVATPHRRDPAAAGTTFVQPDPRMAPYLSTNVRYGPVRKMPFGVDVAYFTAGPSKTPPGTVFGEILRRFAPATDEESRRRVLARGPSAVEALRAQPTLAKFQGGVALVHLAPVPVGLSPASTDDAEPEFEHLTTEPGGVVLAFDYGDDKWEYAVFFFPNGLDVETFTRTTTPPPDALASLGADAVDALTPQLRLGGDGRGGLVTTLCRANGPAGAAVDRVAKGLSKQGFKELAGVRSGGGGDDVDVVRVLEGPRGTIWLTTSEREVDGGLVTVTMTAL